MGSTYTKVMVEDQAKEREDLHDLGCFGIGSKERGGESRYIVRDGRACRSYDTSEGKSSLRGIQVQHPIQPGAYTGDLQHPE